MNIIQNIKMKLIILKNLLKIYLYNLIKILLCKLVKVKFKRIFNHQIIYNNIRKNKLMNLVYMILFYNKVNTLIKYIKNYKRNYQMNNYLNLLYNSILLGNKMI